MSLGWCRYVGDRGATVTLDRYGASAPGEVVLEKLGLLRRERGRKREGASRMRVAVGFDHAGFPLKHEVLRVLAELGHEVRDFGTDSAAPVDYPDFAKAVGLAVARGECERGIVVCGSGVGRVRRGDEDPGNPVGALPRHVLRAPGRRGRRHERRVPWSPGDRSVAGRGSDAGVSGARVSRISSATSGV